MFPPAMQPAVPSNPAPWGKMPVNHMVSPVPNPVMPAPMAFYPPQPQEPLREMPVAPPHIPAGIPMFAAVPPMHMPRNPHHDGRPMGPGMRPHGQHVPMHGGHNYRSRNTYGQNAQTPQNASAPAPPQRARLCLEKSFTFTPTANV